MKLRLEDMSQEELDKIGEIGVMIDNFADMDD